MGANVHSHDERQPLVGPREGFIQSAEDLEKIPPSDPQTQARQPLMLEILARLLEALGQDVFIVGCFDQSPFSLACQVCGTENLLLKTIEEPEFVGAVINRCSEYVLAYARAMAACGPDMLSTGDSPAVLLGVEKYATFALPAEKRVFSALREQTEAFISLHICGDSTSLLDQMAKSGADVLEIDHQVSLRKASKIVGDKVALWGNIDPVSVLLQGDPDGIQTSVRELLSEVKKGDCRRFVLSSGCTLAPHTPPENLQAFFAASRSYS